MSGVHELGVVEVRDAVAAGDLGPGDAADAALGRIAAFDGSLNAFVEVLAEPAPGVAGALAGVPVAVKDMFVDRDRSPTVGSGVSGYWLKGTAAVVERLRRAGAAVVALVISASCQA